MATTTEGAITYRIGSVADIPIGEGRTYRVGEIDIAVYRTRGGEVLATQAACPHRGGPLADGIVGDGLVICPLHGFKFRLATGESVGNDCEGLRTFEVSVDGEGEVLLTIEQ